YPIGQGSQTMHAPRKLAAAATAALLLALPAAALAGGGHARHHARRGASHVTGVVKSINIAAHTVTITLPASHHHKARTLTFDVSGANVSGNHGAFAIGDRISVTVPSGSGSATSIRVIGVPNGGTNGHGAAL